MGTLAARHIGRLTDAPPTGRQLTVHRPASPPARQTSMRRETDRLRAGMTGPWTPIGAGQTGVVLRISRINSVTEPVPEPNGTRIAVGQLNGDIWIVGPDGGAPLAATEDLLPPT